MSDQTYHIYYLDLASGISAEDAIDKLSQLPKLTFEKATQLVLSKDRVIKSGLNKKQAEKYLSNLKKIGLTVEMREESEQSSASVPEAAPIAAAAATATAAISTSAEQPAASEASATPEQAVPASTAPNAILNETSEEDFRSVQVEFHGQAFEYFKIWIVNIFLTIITLGIYYAWAKVRNKQYFYGNTTIEGSSFNYTANPIAILKGWFIGTGFFVIYSLVSELYPMAGLALMLVFLPIVPWLIVKSLAFNARNSLYRNVSFDFKGKYGEATVVFLLLPLLVLITAGLILPYIWYKQNRFVIAHSAFGTTDFEYHAEPKDFFRIFFVALGALLVAGLLVFGASTLLDQQLATITAGLIIVPLYVWLFGYYTASITNLNYNSTTLDRHYFTSTLEAKKMAWLYFTNTLAIALSLGLMIPWAKVRMARYRAECLQLEVAGSLDNFIAAEQQNVSALGEQIGEAFDVEMSVI